MKSSKKKWSGILLAAVLCFSMVLSASAATDPYAYIDGSVDYDGNQVNGYQYAWTTHANAGSIFVNGILYNGAASKAGCGGYGYPTYPYTELYAECTTTKAVSSPPASGSWTSVAYTTTSYTNNTKSDRLYFYGTL
ncbi:hypothetical protein [Paenibacillus koleovorans]|uniref:hypothetical protein n=1 Tax=Paenibacillus koleovorans TaxID=121608 RepID=UPI000FDCA2CF|nr:hypothetical protein [Paenibacillus koleovorans]